MRIALFSEVYWPMVSGVGVTLDRLVQALEARGHAVRVYTGSYPVPDGVPDRPEVHRSPSVPLFLYPDVQWAFPRPRELVADLALFRPDVVHVATEFAMGLAGVKAAAQLGLPILASAHTDYHKYATRYGVPWVLSVGWIYLRWFYRHAERVLVPSRVYERFLNSRGVTHTGLWTRGVDPAHFHPRFRSEAWRARFGVGPDDLLVTYIGRLAKEKDLLRLVAAWQALRASRGNAQLVLVGRGPLEEELRQAQIPGLHVAGLLEGRALSEAYASADLFAFPSATETFGNSLLEAMASGLPSLAVRAGGVMEFAEHGVNAWLAPPGDTGALTQALGRLLAAPALRARLSAGAQATAAARGWDAIYDGLFAEYAQVAAGRREVRAA
ncbi:MAG: glycosyltransferase family 1 protein [Gemmatimonadetes bacterium]|nr:glycosyltransferase family 1 protein [Gemmatimonadota bacterium]MBK7349971.1 glycosyltransferase family 1 protein [Gemmatimonadota bacterium]MBK7784597.1 glycosyltransferase family 1 protein [Gemmatimonadota bacterium]MBK7925554.1 glycosyltransferase family 1 protein [Gemmatimonadota bacterium]